MNGKEKTTGRVLSVDALRGFAVLCIIGADGTARAFSEMAGGREGWSADVARFAGRQFTHARWDGFHFYDLIFPLFLFTVGLSIPLSLAAARCSMARRTALLRVLRRSMLLFALGIVYNIGWDWSETEIRFAGVLQRIAICYLVAAVCFLYLPAYGIVVATGVIVAGYAVLLVAVPVPGSRVGPYDEEMNLAVWVDQMWLVGRKHFDDWDPEGLLTTVPAAASALIGVAAGLLLADGRLTARRKPAAWASAGLVMLGAGLALACEVPVIKALWTASYILISGGLSLILFAAAYGVIDVAGRVGPAWAAIWVGANAILFYVLDRFVGFGELPLDVLAMGGFEVAGGVGGAHLVASAAGLGLAVAIARALHERRLFLRL